MSIVTVLLLDGGWTTKSPADGNKSLSFPTPGSITADYSGRDHITEKDCFWIARLVKKHN